MAAGGQLSAAIKDADVIQSKKAAFKQVFAKAVFAVHPPTEVQHQLRKHSLEKLQVTSSFKRLFRPIEKDGRPGMHGRVNVTEVPLVGRHLPSRVEKKFLKQQRELFLGEIDIDSSQCNGVEGEVPRGVPGILPLVRHRNDASAHHVEPFVVSGSAGVRPEWIYAVLLQPFVYVITKILLAPQHSRQRLSHDQSLIFADPVRRDALIELICLALTCLHDLIKALKRIAYFRRIQVSQPQPDRSGFTCANIQWIMCGSLGSFALRVDRLPFAIHYVVVDRILYIRTLARRAKDPFLVRFILREQQFMISLKVEVT